MKVTGDPDLKILPIPRTLCGKAGKETSRCTRFPSNWEARKYFSRSVENLRAQSEVVNIYCSALKISRSTMEATTGHSKGCQLFAFRMQSAVQVPCMGQISI